MRRAVLVQTRPLREGAGVARIGPEDGALTMADLRVVTRVAALTTALDDALRDR